MRIEFLSVKFFRLALKMKSICKLSVAIVLAIVFTALALTLTRPIVHAQDDSANSSASPMRSPIAIPVIPQITLSPMPGYGPAPLIVGFMLASSDPSGAPFGTYRWNFGDGQVSTMPPIAMFHTYANPGSYVVTVTATTTDGHQASAFAGVIVTPPLR